MPQLILNIDLEVRQVFVLAKTEWLLDSVDEVYSLISMTRSFSGGASKKNSNVVITRAQKLSLHSVGDLVHYLKVRLAA